MRLVRMLLTAALLVSAFPALAAPQRLTQAQAVQVARAFCARVGVAAGEAWTARCIEPGQKDYPEDSHWQPVWLVTFADEAEVVVVDADSVIAKFTHFALQRRLQAENRPAGRALPQGEAIQRARRILRFAGPTKEFMSPKSERFQFTRPATAAGHLWVVRWKRHFFGIPYQGQEANITLQAETGELLSFARKRLSPAPESSSIGVRRPAALRAASAMLLRSGVKGFVIKTVRKQVVRPNRYWPERLDDKPIPGIARIAWVCYAAAQNVTHEVWVDAKTGEVIGGETIDLSRKPLSLS